ncbi:MAG: hypothetical protein N4J56_006990 [Chroococcidiopsis sp. SAG 2025]|uniref:DUF1822 family protein n=1 Tax=Chroococcidiopsis sp. SAG 2025 TaxID=171389 RepID=UPI000D06A86F|nr:DUF1822 family protein [Chroococcidiopsis sp. SAG 2025]MDV2997285.1 hypothetical protein [Chroococcidiopsis sp. SAG 2025]PSB49150.1 hypothetical protein C7B80_02830 [Cyanosarcina cf. burmensis CCALA 770]
MMRELSTVSTFKVPLGIEAHDLARAFWQQHRDRAKAKQVYLNTLAVSAVDFYLRCLGIETNWAASSSRNLVYQLLMDIADLEIPNLGRLECRPVLPEVDVVSIPPEVWSERIGYVAVQLDASLQEATLLGFTTTVPESGELPLAQLQAIVELPAHLQQIQLAKLSKVQVLSQWFENLFDGGWQSLETLLATNRQTLALRHGHISQLHENSVQGVKLIDLGLQIGNQSLALLIALVSESDEQVSVMVQLHPTGTENYLSPDIKLTLLLESGEIEHTVQSRHQDNYIQLKRFRGRPGECFNIQVAYGEISVTENFII